MNTTTSIAKNLFGAKSWRSPLQLLIALAIVCCGSMARAQFHTETWLGAATGTATWTNIAAWTPQNTGFDVSSNGDALIFGNQSQLITVSGMLNPQNNFPTTVVHTGAGGYTNQFGIYSITFNTNGFVLGGNALQITNGITDNYGANSNAIGLTLGAGQSFQNNSVSGFTNTESGTIQLVTNTLTIGGSAPLFLTGAISSTNGGNLVINSGGLIRLAAANAFGTNTILITNVF